MMQSSISLENLKETFSLVIWPQVRFVKDHANTAQHVISSIRGYTRICFVAHLGAIWSGNKWQKLGKVGNLGGNEWIFCWITSGFLRPSVVYGGASANLPCG